ncbi:hypothetical protein Desde_1388 [Desulfitobacterium dehalogenans ATCC 51507]|uniref:Uncharacterized protein n=1 Tax=Desulfitobacterium dehalogenans (strain ATCC 51507 / DSM 9161 / JW/IU-DC1) TaxID=756499 RepID=I4A777_DESDJ|nr:hypothetical protein [Desulfitobacterium dehalogenans]AFL99811.1 hypothetical protein Desde_1388 [Desulfitobacterium dehalogenans ATCC 51507]
MNEDTKRMFHGISTTSIERYLLLKGWDRDYQFKNPNLLSFIYKPLNKRIAISASDKFQDFYFTLESALQTISLIQNKSIGEIIKEISNVYFDKMEFRIISSLTEDGKMPLKYASECIEGITELILYSACAEQNAQPICFRATNFAKDYLQNFKLAQTDVGSFVINVDIQVVDDVEEQLVLEGCTPPIPFEHKIVERIFTAIEQVNDIVERQQVISDVAETAYKTGITANMCDALLKMKPENGEAEINATLKYASLLTIGKDESKSIDIGNHHFWTIDELAKIYRDKVLYDDVILTGVVKSLSKKDVEETTEKTIRLLTNYNGKYRVIFMELPDEEHRIACDAYRDDLEVEVSGELDMSNRTWVLSKIKYFKII